MKKTGNYPTFTFHLGDFISAPARRAAYEKAAKKAGYESTGKWVRDLCDKASRFDKRKKKT